MSFFLIWLVDDAFEENIEIKGQGGRGTVRKGCNSGGCGGGEGAEGDMDGVKEVAALSDADYPASSGAEMCFPRSQTRGPPNPSGWLRCGPHARVGSALVGCDGLPKLDAISFRIGNPAKLSEVIAFAFWIDGDPFVDQTVQHAVQVVHLEIDHCFLGRREVCIVLFEKGEDDLGVLRGGRKRE